MDDMGVVGSGENYASTYFANSISLNPGGVCLTGPSVSSVHGTSFEEIRRNLRPASLTAQGICHPVPGVEQTLASLKILYRYSGDGREAR